MHQRAVVLIGSNRQFIQDTIPHFSSLLSNDLDETIRGAEVVVVGTKAVSHAELAKKLRPEQVMIDVVNVD